MFKFFFILDPIGANPGHVICTEYGKYSYRELPFGGKSKKRRRLGRASTDEESVIVRLLLKEWMLGWGESMSGLILSP